MVVARILQSCAGLEIWVNEGNMNAVSAVSAKSHVLVVDDEPDIRELLGMTLARMGVESHGAATREEAQIGRAHV